jgi:hypothetical protein
VDYGLVDLLESGLTCIGAALARLGAYAAVLVFSRMPLALLPAFLARLRASLDHSTENLDIGSRAPRRHRARRRADIGAVQVEPDALPQLVNHRFREARIRARGAGLSATVAFFDASQELVGRASLNVGMRADHFANVHGIFSFQVLEPVKHTP